MSFIKIEGQNEIKGTIEVSGNKNAALPILAATLLIREKVVLKRLPEILDVKSMLEILKYAGASYEFKNNCLEIDNSKVNISEISHELCSKNRTSILIAAPLLYRLGAVKLYPPGGDVIGRRRLDGHIYGLKKLGATLNYDIKFYDFKLANGFVGQELFLDEASVTATEQILMAAVCAKGTTILYNAACEPHVVDLANFLNAMGGKISGAGGNVITIEGVDELHGGEYEIDEDYIEAGSFLALAAANHGELTVTGITPRKYWMMRRVFERLGVKLELHPNKIYLSPNQTFEIEHDFDGQMPSISDGTWPQYPSDMMSCTIVAATQMVGTTLFFEKMFESRLWFVDRLISMGARAVVCDPHRVVISGKSNLYGTELSSPDIRAGMAMVIAATCAKNESIINNIEVILRGYENLIQKLQEINVKITN